MTEHRRGWSTADGEPEQPGPRLVQVPQPVFDGVDEKNRYEDAVAETKRLPGESLTDYLARVVAAAQAGAPREPGTEG